LESGPKWQGVEIPTNIKIMWRIYFQRV